MEFERLVSSLDAEGLSLAAEALLRLLSGGEAGRASALSVPDARQRSRAGAPSPLSAAEAAGPLPGAGGGRRNAPAAAEALSAFHGGAAEGTAQVEKRLDADAARKLRAPEAEELARIGEQLAAVSERNRRAFGQGALAEAVPPYVSADGGVMANGSAAGAGQAAALSAHRAVGLGAAAVPGEAEIAPAHRAAAPAARDLLDAEAVSEIFRRDSRRYDSGFSD